MFIVILNMFKVATKTNVYVVDDPYGQRKEATRTSRDPFEVSFIVQKVTKIHIYRYNKQKLVLLIRAHTFFGRGALTTLTLLSWDLHLSTDCTATLLMSWPRLQNIPRYR